MSQLNSPANDPVSISMPLAISERLFFLDSPRQNVVTEDVSRGQMVKLSFGSGDTGDCLLIPLTIQWMCA